MNDLLKSALKYATEYGFAVFPCKVDKKPITKHGCQDATTDPVIIREWWTKNPKASIGIATGSKSQLVVIDEDIDEAKGLNGFEEVSAWERINTPLPETVTCKTGRGGYHLYYRYDGNDISCRIGILDGVDIRAEGGYVIAPPSNHPNGNQYAWEFPPDEHEIAQLDDTVKAFLTTNTETRERFFVPAEIPNGKRNDTLFKLACSLQAQGLPDAAIKEALRQTNLNNCLEPLDDKELDLILNSAIEYPKGKLATETDEVTADGMPNLARYITKDGKPGKPLQTIDNCVIAIRYDPGLKGRIFYNEISYAVGARCPIPWDESNRVKEWTPSDDTHLLSYIEKKYGLSNLDKISKGLDIVAHDNRINPVRVVLEKAYEEWDGKTDHIASLLPSMLGAVSNPYNYEVMKLVMLGAIARTYHPGTKFDYAMTLIGRQGIGKSKFCSELAINSEWFNDNFNTMEGDKAAEKLRGMWILELAELLATRRTKDVEAIKAFLSSNYDVYREPYSRRTERRPRRCIFIGTTNNVDFLTDTTGNRRFLPVEVGINEPTFDMWKDPEITRSEILQAWGEAMDIYKQSGENPSLILQQSMLPEALKMQERYTEEDSDIGIIQAWLDSCKEDIVCGKMIWVNALNGLYTPFEKRDSHHISDIMHHHIKGWKPMDGKHRTQKYGVQRCYERIKKNSDAIAEEPVPYD